jgi:hypothetical protein
MASPFSAGKTARCMNQLCFGDFLLHVMRNHLVNGQYIAKGFGLTKAWTK